MMNRMPIERAPLAPATHPGPPKNRIWLLLYVTQRRHVLDRPLRPQLQQPCRAPELEIVTRTVRARAQTTHISANLESLACNLHQYARRHQPHRSPPDAAPNSINDQLQDCPPAYMPPPRNRDPPPQADAAWPRQPPMRLQTAPSQSLQPFAADNAMMPTPRLLGT